MNNIEMDLLGAEVVFWSDWASSHSPCTVMAWKLLASVFLLMINIFQTYFISIFIYKTQLTTI